MNPFRRIVGFPRRTWRDNRSRRPTLHGFAIAFGLFFGMVAVIGEAMSADAIVVRVALDVLVFPVAFALGYALGMWGPFAALRMFQPDDDVRGPSEHR
jgi:hypothetical protein